MWQLLQYEWFVVSMSMQVVLRFIVDMLDLVELCHVMVLHPSASKSYLAYMLSGAPLQVCLALCVAAI